MSLTFACSLNSGVDWFRQQDDFDCKQVGRWDAAR